MFRLQAKILYAESKPQKAFWPVLRGSTKRRPIKTTDSSVRMSSVISFDFICTNSRLDAPAPSPPPPPTLSLFPFRVCFVRCLKRGGYHEFVCLFCVVWWKHTFILTVVCFELISLFFLFWMVSLLQKQNNGMESSPRTLYIVPCAALYSAGFIQRTPVIKSWTLTDFSVKRTAVIKQKQFFVSYQSYFQRIHVGSLVTSEAWRIWYFYHKCGPCLLRHTHRRLGIKWQHSRPCCRDLQTSV